MISTMELVKTWETFSFHLRSFERISSMYLYNVKSFRIKKFDLYIVKSFRSKKFDPKRKESYLRIRSILVLELSVSFIFSL